MSDYKMVPVEMALPCPFCGSSNIGNKYIETYSTDSSYDTFGCKDCGARFEDGCQDDWNRRAAPAVRGDPVAWMVTCIRPDFDKPIKALHSVQMLADEQQRHWEGRGCLVYQTRLYAAPQPAEQQPAPDVAGLVEALETALFGTPLDDVSNRDNDDIWCLCYPHLPERASDALRDHLVRIETALAAHRKQGG